MCSRAGNLAPFRQVRSRGTSLPSLLQTLAPPAPPVIAATPVQTSPASQSRSSSNVLQALPPPAQPSNLSRPLQSAQTPQITDNLSALHSTQQQCGPSLSPPAGSTFSNHSPSLSPTITLHHAAVHEGVISENGAVSQLAPLPDVTAIQDHLLPGADIDLSQQLSQLQLHQEHQQQSQQHQSRPLSSSAGARACAASVAVEQSLQDCPQEGQASLTPSQQCSTAGDVQVLDGPAEWIWFCGEWGTTLAPIAQGWFHTAETPVSRSALLRVAMQAWPETQRV